MILDGANQKVQRITGDAGDLRVKVSWLHVNGSTVTLGSDSHTLTDAATSDIIAAPGASQQRYVKEIVAANEDPVAQPLILQYVDGTDTVPLWEGTLLQNEKVKMDETGKWTLYDSSGNDKASTFPAAIQSEQEAGVSNVVSVTPGNQHWHPSAAKCWGFTTGGGTPVLNAQSYNMTSITDTATGRLTVTIATDFSSASWVALMTPGISTTNVRITGSVSKAAGSVILETGSAAATLADPATGWDWVFFGDQ